MNDITSIAFLGTGLMGAPMACRLVAAGYRLQAWNRSAEKVAALAGDGIRPAASPGEAVRGADVVITMLSNGAAVTEVLFRRALASMKPGAIVVDMSSTGPSTARDHAARLDAAGFAHLDAPVSGGTVGARDGTLAIMAGGPEEIFEEVSAVLQVLGRPVHVGPAGSGQLAKLCNQSIVAITIGAVAEALHLAERSGANPAAMRQALRGGFAESRILEEHGQRMLERNFIPGGPAVHQLKDLDNALEAADAAGIDLPLTRQVRDRYRRLVEEMGQGGLDHSALLLELEAGNA